MADMIDTAAISMEDVSVEILSGREDTLQEEMLRSKIERLRKRRTRYAVGYKGMILKICLTAGGISYNGLQMLAGDRKTYTNAIRDFVRDGLMTIHWIGRNCVGVFLDFNNTNVLYKDSFMPYIGTYNRFCAQRAKNLGSYKSSRSGAIKAARYSEIIMLLSGTSVNVLTEDKPALYNKETIADDAAYFYSDTEVKIMVEGDNVVKEENMNSKYVISSRAQGFILSRGGIYMLYHSGAKRMAWRSTQEQQMQFRVASLIGKSTVGQYKSINVDDCIIYADSAEPFVEMFVDDIEHIKSRRFKYASLENGFKNTYYLPYTEDGQYMTDLMVHADWQDKILKYFMDGDKELHREKYYSVADLNNGENPIFVFCIPNATRLNSFLMTAEIMDEDYYIYCFDFQVEFLTRVVDGRAKIFSIPLEEFKAEFSL